MSIIIYMVYGITYISYILYKYIIKKRSPSGAKLAA